MSHHLDASPVHPACPAEFQFGRSTLHCERALPHVGLHMSRGVMWFGSVRFPRDKRYGVQV